MRYTRNLTRGRSSRRSAAFAVATVAAGAGCLSILAGAGAQGPAWFGLPLPGAATGQVLDFNAVDLRPIDTVGRTVHALEGERIHRTLRDVVDISYQSRAAGDRIWGRLSGTRWEAMTMDYVAKRLRGAGVEDVTQDVFQQRSAYSLPTQWSVKLLGAGSDAPVELQSAVPMELDAAAAGQLTAPLIYVGRGADADIAGRDVRGKIALIRTEPEPTFFYSDTSSATAKLRAAGAVGVLRLWDAPGNMQSLYGSCSGIPCFNVGGEDSAFLEAVIARAGSAGALDQLRLDLSVSLDTSVRSARQVVGMVRGRDHRENIVLTAHGDSWWAGAGDNASGVAGLIALAEYYGERRNRPAHDIYFVVTPGHEQNQGGAQRFVDRYPDVVKRNILSVNLEHIAATGVYRSYMGRFRREVDKYGNPLTPFVPANWDSQGREVSMTPLSPFLKRAWEQAATRNGITGPALLQQPAVADPAPIVAGGGHAIQDVETSLWYHTSGDTPATISSQSLERKLHFYRDFVDTVDAASRAVVERGAQ